MPRTGRRSGSGCDGSRSFFSYSLSSSGSALVGGTAHRNDGLVVLFVHRASEIDRTAQLDRCGLESLAIGACAERAAHGGEGDAKGDEGRGFEDLAIGEARASQDLHVV